MLHYRRTNSLCERSAQIVSQTKNYLEVFILWDGLVIVPPTAPGSPGANKDG